MEGSGFMGIYRDSIETCSPVRLLDKFSEKSFIRFIWCGTKLIKKLAPLAKLARSTCSNSMRLYEEFIVVLCQDRCSNSVPAPVIVFVLLLLFYSPSTSWLIQMLLL